MNCLINVDNNERKGWLEGVKMIMIERGKIVY